MRIGVFGGTFDPIHCGHLLCAAQVREGLLLDRILFIPTGRPPHKQGSPVLAPHHRLAMTQLATNSYSDFFVSVLEVERPGCSYSVDTVAALQRQFSADAELYFILGSDAFEQIDSWKDTDRLLHSCHLVVVQRPGAAATAPYPVLQEKVKSRYPELEFLPPQPRGSGSVIRIKGSCYGVFFLPITALDISASEIRRRLRAGLGVTGMVPAEIEHYIVKYGLYRKEDS